MKSFRFSTVACCLAAVVCCQAVHSGALWGQAASAEEAAPPEEKTPAAKAKPPQDTPFVLPPKKLLPPGQLFEHRVLATPLAVAGQQKVDPKPAAKQAVQPPPVNDGPLPANRRANAPFWPPRQTQQQSQRSQENPSRAATYQLQSLGRHIHLTPAMRWHLNRSGVAVDPTSNVPLSSATTVPGQGAGTFYPGVARAPIQKPFADVVRPTTGIPDYWPLLLEGRQDPNSGLIIWTLP